MDNKIKKVTDIILDCFVREDLTFNEIKVVVERLEKELENKKNCTKLSSLYI